MILWLYLHSSTGTFLISEFASSTGLAGAMQSRVPSSQEVLSESHTQPQVPSLVLWRVLLATEHAAVLRDPFSKRPAHASIDAKP